MSNTKLEAKNNSVNWGIIGCGNVTEFKSGPAFNRVPNSSLVAVMRRDADKAKDYAKRHQVPKWYHDANDLINDPDISAIYIATPPKYHEEYAIAAMQAGKPVYVEKPMALDVASCYRMKEFSDRSGIKLSIAHYRRALPMFLKVKSLIDEHVIGDIKLVNIRMLQPDQSVMIAKTSENWRVDPKISGGGIFFDLAPHQLDLVHYFFGSATSYFGVATNQAGLYQAEDIVSGSMLLKNNIVFNAVWCFTVPENAEEDLFEIIGSKGKISFPVFGNTIEVEIEGNKEQISFSKEPHIQEHMIAKIVQYFLGTAPNPCSAADAIQSMELMEKFVYGK
ncbi:MAG: Gfo/Idh/MocA family oxidoreductase [Bacteroidota bacterium]